MAKKAENKDIFKGNIFEPTQSQSEDFAKSLLFIDEIIEDIVKQNKELIKTNTRLAKQNPLKSYGDVKNVEKNILAINQAVKNLTNVELARKKVLQQIQQINKQELNITRQLIKEINKKTKELLKAKKALTDANKATKESVKVTKEVIKADKEAIKTEQATQKAKKVSEKAEKKAEKAKKESLKTSEELSSNEKTRKKLLDRLADSQEDSAQTNALLNEELIEQRKVLKATAREALGLTDEYGRQAARLTEARREYKSLFLETEKNRKGLKGLIFRLTSSGKALRKLKKEVLEADKKLKDLDNSVGQNERSVGAYKEAIAKVEKQLAGLTKQVRKVNSVLKRLGIVFIITKSIEAFNNALGANADTSLAVEKALSRITITITVLISRLGKSLPALGELFDVFINKLELFGLKAERLYEKLSFGSDETIEKIESQIKALDKSISESKGFDNLAKAFEGLTDEISETLKANDKFLENQQATRRQIIEITRNLSLEAKARKNLFNNLGLEIEQREKLSTALKEIVKDGESLIQADSRLEEQSESNFVSLQDRIKATEDLIVVRQAILSQEVKQAQLERDLAAQRASIFKDSIDASEDLANAEKNLAEVTTAANRAILNSEREKADIETDLIERELDFIIDVADRRKAVNEDRINDDTISFARRKALLNENERITEEAFEKEIEAINQGLREGAKRLDFNELLIESDERVINERVLGSIKNDKLAARALEIIKERIQFTRDLEVSERDLQRARQEGREIEEDIELQLETLSIVRNNQINANKELEKLEEARAKQSIRDIEERLKFVEEGSAEELKLRQELFEKLLSEEEKQGQKLLEQRQKIQEASSEVITAFGEKLFDDRLSALDKELEAIKQRSNELRTLAAQNVDGAVENLANAQKREAEIERQRERTRKAQAKSKAFLTLLDTASAKAAAGDENAIVNTIFDAQVLRAFVQTLPTFFEGTDLTGNGNVDNKGGFLSVLHPNEMVLSNADRMDMDGAPTTRSEVIAGYNLGRTVLAKGNDIPNSVTVTNTYDDRLLGEIKEMKQAIKNMPHTGLDYNPIMNWITDIVKEGNSTTNNHRKAIRRH